MLRGDTEGASDPACDLNGLIGEVRGARSIVEAQPTVEQSPCGIMLPARDSPLITSERDENIKHHSYWHACDKHTVNSPHPQIVLKPISPLRITKRLGSDQVRAVQEKQQTMPPKGCALTSPGKPPFNV